MAYVDTVSPALATLKTALDIVTTANGGVLERATPPQLAPVKVALRAALAALDARIAVLDASIIETSVGGVTVGPPVTAVIATLIDQSKIVRELSALRDTRAYVARLNANVTTIGG